MVPGCTKYQIKENQLSLTHEYVILKKKNTVFGIYRQRKIKAKGELVVWYGKGVCLYVWRESDNQKADW